jgi:hypothetical protein
MPQNKVSPLTPEQKERIAVNRAAAFAKLQGRKILYDHNSSNSMSAETKRRSEVTPQNEEHKKRRTT